MAALTNIPNDGVDVLQPGVKHRELAGTVADAPSVDGLQIDNLTITYGRHQEPVVKDFNFSIHTGGFGVLLGPSGSGKSTVLNACAGLLHPAGGRISVANRVLFDAANKVLLPPDKRDLGMVFQSYALWPHLTVRGNVEYPLRRRKIRGAALKAKVDAALELVQCGRLADRYPGQLSGGQQQRVALARAIVAEPAVLLFDEPLSNLDAELRRQLRNEIAALHQRVGFTALYVTHDQSEALGLGTTLAIMEAGLLVQSGRPHDVHDKPKSVTAARFFGANVWRVPRDGAFAQTPVGTVDVGGLDTAEVDVAAYPHNIRMEPDPSGPGLAKIARFLGSSTEYVVDFAGQEVRVSGPPEGYGVRAGDRLRMVAKKEHVFSFAAQTDAAAKVRPT
jgi:ABC-type Fe3+/spermidine/putrescine transport system ATPase subunit